MIRAGSLREIVTLYVPHEAFNAANEVDVQHNAAWQVRAEVTIDSSTEAVIDGQVAEAATYKIRMRTREIAGGWRIDWRGKALEVKKIVPYGDRRDELVITAYEVR